MKCYNCGNEVKENDRYCMKCGNKINNEKKANSLCLLAIILVTFHLLGGVIIPNAYNLDTTNRIIRFIYNLGIISLLGSIFLVIYTRVKYPSNLFSKVLMYIYIIASVIAVIVYIIVALFIFYAIAYHY